MSELKDTGNDTINRQETIDFIEKASVWVSYTLGDMQYEDEFVESIIKQTKKAIISMIRLDMPPAQPNLQPTCNQLATDTVYRQAVIDVIAKRIPSPSRLFADGVYLTEEELFKAQDPYVDCIEAIEALPSAQMKKSVAEWQKDFREYIDMLNIPRDDYNGIMGYINEVPSAQPDEKLRKIADIVEGTIDHFDRDDAMDLLYKIKDVVR